MSRADLTAKLLAQGRIKPEDLHKETVLDLSEGDKSKPDKYHRVKVEVNGEKFDSKLEYAVCCRLRGIYGEKRVIRQVSIPIGKKRIRPDFMIIHSVNANGTFTGELVDAKGFMTPAWEAKANHLLDAHGLAIRLVRG